MDMKVSIIIPVYNVASYIEECIQSVLDQTYPDLEVVLVDDCGTDHSMELAENLIRKSNRSSIFRIEKHDRNRGLSAARNTGIKTATGEYLYFVDSDDKISQDCIEKLVQFVRCYPQVEMVYAGSNLYSMKNEIYPIYISDANKIKKSILSKAFPITAWNRLVSRTFILSNRLFFMEGIVHEDELWNFYLAKHLKYVGFLHEDTYCYRYNPCGIMSSRLQKQCDSMDVIIKDCAKHIDNRCIFKQLEFILHITHTNYVKRYKAERQFVFIRYIGAILYLLKVLFFRHEQKV